MAGRAVAHLDDVLSLGFQREVLIERGYAVDLGNTDAEFFRDLFQGLTAQILVFGLNVLHDRDDVFTFAAVGIDDFLYALQHRIACIHWC